MRKALLPLLTLILAIGLAVVLGGVYLRRHNAYRVKRAQEAVDEIERLEIGKSDHTVADAIAAKFGIAPPPYWLRNRYNRENCAAPDHFLRGQVKTGHAGSLQNRPYEMAQDVILSIPFSLHQASLF